MPDALRGFQQAEAAGIGQREATRGRDEKSEKDVKARSAGREFQILDELPGVD